MVIFLAKEEAGTAGTAVRPLSNAEAAARLYANALNQLAHENAGLGTVAQIASAVPAFEIRRQSLDKMVGTVTELCKADQRM